MSEIKLLHISNYPISEKKCWNNGISFIEKGEADFPFSFEDSPDVLSSIGRPFETSLGIIASNKGSAKRLYDAYRLGLECALNKTPYMTSYFAKGSGRALLDGSIEGEGRVMVLLPGGMKCYLGSRRLFSHIVLNDGALVSVFEPDEGVKRENNFYNHYLMENCTFTVFVSLGFWEYNHALNLLDKGRALFLLRSSLEDRYARQLAFEGAPVIDSISEIISSPSGYLYEDEKGDYVYDKTHRLSFLKLK